MGTEEFHVAVPPLVKNRCGAAHGLTDPSWPVTATVHEYPRAGESSVRGTDARGAEEATKPESYTVELDVAEVAVVSHTRYALWEGSAGGSAHERRRGAVGSG
jgi:hypothetical protein